MQFLLLHGSWHGGWCWDRLKPILEERGHTVSAPTLIGLGELSAEVTPDTGLHTHVAQIAELIRRENFSDVVVVGHSYAGLLMVELAELVADRLAYFVYLDALVPGDDQSAFDLMPGVEESFRKRMKESGSDYLVPPLPPDVMGISDPDDVAWMLKRLTPMPIRTHMEKVRAPEQAAMSIPSSYIRCLQFSLGATYAAWAKEQGWPVFELDTGHDAMITEPVALAELLDRAAA
jgi:pimeloyl-ACP methyl ester carboxylesterase